jgi:hypothetical protein
LKIRLPSTIQSNSGSKIKIQRNQRRTNDRYLLAPTGERL